MKRADALMAELFRYFRDGLGGARALTSLLDAKVFRKNDCDDDLSFWKEVAADVTNSGNALLKLLFILKVDDLLWQDLPDELRIALIEALCVLSGDQVTEVAEEAADRLFGAYGLGEHGPSESHGLLLSRACVRGFLESCTGEKLPAHQDRARQLLTITV